MLIQTNFIAGKMNKSVDERLVPVGEYVDALNVRLGSTETTEIGAVENSKGNTLLTPIIQYLGNELSANAKCIGAFEDGMAETIYWFVTDPGNTDPAFPIAPEVDMILSYNTNTNTLTYHVVSIEVLNFNLEYLITGVDKIEDLLFFTDNLNPPRYINVTRNYPTPDGVADGIEEEDISVIVKPPGFEDINLVTATQPLRAPYVELQEAPNDEDYMETRFICFAYRYRYQDGGYSATSLFTSPAFAPQDFEFSVDTMKNEGMINKFNQAKVWFSTGSSRVKDIQLLYKDTSSNNIFIVKRFNKADLGIADNVFETYTFTNSNILSVLGSDELLRLYDNVPRTAQAQTIQGNRLMYGNFVEQYDLTAIKDGDPINLNFQVRPESEFLDGDEFPTPTGASAAYTINPASGETINNASITFDLSQIPGAIYVGTAFRFELGIQSVQNTRTGADAQPSNIVIPDFTVTLNFIAAQNYPDPSAMLNSQEFANAVGSSGIFQQLLPYTVPAPPAYPPTANPAVLGATLTDSFNTSLPYAWLNAGTGNSLLLMNTAITSQCPAPPVPAGTFPPLTQPCTQQSFGLSVAGSTFTLTVPAAQYYWDNNAGSTTTQFEYFSFNLGASFGGWLTTPVPTSLHSHRDYEVGIVYMDEYGRSSTVLTSPNNTVYFPARTAIFQNKIHAKIMSPAPYWSRWYKFVVKPSQGKYETIWSTLSFQQTGCDPVLLGEACGPTPFGPDLASFWFRLEGDSQNIVSVGDMLTIKRDANGPVGGFLQAEVLDKESVYSGQINGTNPPGVWMRLKASGWNGIPNDATPNINSDVTVVNERNGVDNCDDINEIVPATSVGIVQSNGDVQPIPAGSTVRVKAYNRRLDTNNNLCTNKQITWDSGNMLVDADYDNIHACLQGLGFPQMVNTLTADAPVEGMDIVYDNTLYGVNDEVPVDCFVSKIYCTKDGNTYFINNKSALPTCHQGLWTRNPSHTQLQVVINFSNGTFCFETEPDNVDPNLFYDASQMMRTRQELFPPFYRYHEGPSTWDPNGAAGQFYYPDNGSVSQNFATPMEGLLDFFDCYTFGNGVESFRIEDRIDGKFFLLGQRVMAQSNQTYAEVDRFAGLTYSGVFLSASGSNNLNEFNLGLVNYKDLESSFGPIKKLHSRETDILVLQEDRISYVLADKNIITDSTGGGAITSVPEVLGTQIARLEEYGISFNPESFVSWGSNMFFTDTKRGAVLHLKGGSARTDNLNVISSLGMRSWFRDQFNAQLTTQKLGGYDPYMGEYVLGTNNVQVPIPLVELPCGQQISQNQTNQTLSFEVNFGAVVGTVSIPYIISSGGITISVLWNGGTYTTGLVTTNGTLTFPKSLANPSTAVITITPDTSAGIPLATYNLTPECPPEPTVTVIQVVVNGNNYIGESTHVEYQWTNGGNVSPISSTSVVFNNTGASSLYSPQTGVMSQGVFPYDGSNITLRNNQISPDNFVFNPVEHKFKILSSNTLYANTVTDLSTLLSTATEITPITPLTAGESLYQATENAFSMPAVNDYLYLVWDYRNVHSDQLCYSAASADDACCNCSTACTRVWFSPVQSNQPSACAVDTDSFGSTQLAFTGAGSIPVNGDIVYEAGNASCDPELGYAPSGFYIVDPTSPSTANPKNWIQIGLDGLVISSGTC